MITRRIPHPLPVERIRTLEGWAMVQRAAAYVWQPTNVDDIRATLLLARTEGRTVAPRGTGNSYNDAALNREEMVLDLSGMRCILAWDAATGVITAEPGVTVRDLWRATVADGWWPWVVPGTMGPTLGGCLAMNVHGKNAWHIGSFGEYVLAFDLLTPDGVLLHVTPEGQPDLFHAVIGGLGMLGIITSVTLRLRRITAGTLVVRQFAAPSLAGMFARFAEHAAEAEYLVGWIDGFATGAALGRGLVERADFAATPDARSLAPAAQDVPPRIAGVIPRSELWRVLRPAFTDPAMRLANEGQFRRGALAEGHAHAVPHAQFHFFHDYVPNWKRAWLPGGLRQLQAFLPASAAPATFADLLARSQRAAIHPYLCVFKQHRRDPFLLAYQPDGYSLSLDYHVTTRNAARLDVLLRDLRAVVADAGGTFYLAKDDGIDAATYARTIDPDRVAQFLALKRRLDPDGLLRSDLFRRVFGADTGDSSPQRR